MKNLKWRLIGLGLALLLPGSAMANGNEKQEIVVQGHNEFALDLYGQLQSEEGNIFFSPLSISTALSMTYGGARGITATQMAKVLHFPADTKTLHAGNHALLHSLTLYEDAPSRVSVANRLWPALGLELKDPFLNLCQNNYAALPQALDFAGQPEVARLAINDWVRQNTEGMIDGFLNRDDLSPETLLVLTNAIFFKGAWFHEFDPKLTKPGSFHVNSQRQVSVDYMHQTENLRYADIDGAQLLQLPYRHSNLAMFILLPNPTRKLAEFESQLDSRHLQDWVKSLRAQEVDLAFPRLEMSQGMDLAKTLSKMGMADAFTGRADFSGMTDAAIFIDEVYHQAKLEVDEEGTKAAAVTAVVMEKMVPRRVKMQVDRPFLLVIRDIRSGSIVFIGRVVDPGKR